MDMHIDVGNSDGKGAKGNASGGKFGVRELCANFATLQQPLNF